MIERQTSALIVWNYVQWSFPSIANRKARRNLAVVRFCPHQPSQSAPFCPLFNVRLILIDEGIVPDGRLGILRTGLPRCNEASVDENARNETQFKALNALDPFPVMTGVCRHTEIETRNSPDSRI
jgi:hypothetical protein